MKIAIITPFLARGGLERIAVDMSDGLKDKYKLDLIVFDGSVKDYLFSGNTLDLKISFYDRNIIKRLKNIYLIRNKMKKILRNNKYNLIIIHGELANIPLMYLNQKKIVVIHENRFGAQKDFQSKIFTKFAKFIYNEKNIKKIITVSKGIMSDFIKNLKIPKNNIDTIYNLMDIDFIQKQSKQKTDFDELCNFKTIISVGRFSIEKGHKYLFEIFKELKRKDKNIKLILLGEGELKENLISYANFLGLKVFDIEKDDFNLNYDVYFLGFQKNPYAYMAKSDLLLVTSLWEGFGNIIVESMACGTPVISTDCKSGPKEIILDNLNIKSDKFIYGKYGILAPEFKISNNKLDNNQKNMWVENIIKVLNDKELILHYQKMGLIRAKDFDKHKIIKEWEEVIEE